MKQHSRSFGHALTEEDLASTDAEESGDEIWKTSEMHGMEVTEDDSLWKCVKQGCKGYQKIMSNLANVRAHYNSDAHFNAADEVSSSDESLEELDGMEFSQDGGWLCVKRGCKKLGTTYRILYNAKRHSLTDAHAMAEEESPEPEEELDGVEYSDEMAAWVCTKAACKRNGIPFAHIGFARQHARCATHMKAGENAPTPARPSVRLFATPRRAKHSSTSSLLTPVEMADSTIHVSPGSPFAGRGLTLPRRPAGTGTSENSIATQTPVKIRIQRPSATNSGFGNRLTELEKENRELKERVVKLEGEMAQITGSKSPQVPRSPAAGLLAPRHPSAQVSNASSSSLSSPASSRHLESLSQYVREEFRPTVPMEVDEDDMWNPIKY
jgi:hypothetical protein